MGGACNPGGFVGEVGVVSVQKGGKRDTNGLLSCSHTVLQGLAMHQGQIYDANVAA